MMKTSPFSFAFVLGAALVSLSACDGIFEGLYDKPATSVEYGINPNADGVTGTLLIDATDYAQWTYIDLHAGRVDSTRITGTDGTEEPLGDSGILPADWDFAIHRYDVKTNNGAVIETAFTSMDAMLLATGIPDGEYVADTQTDITIDMSGMMDGNILYAQSDCNTELAKWLDVDTSTMPPIYTLSYKVYVVRLEDGTHAALRLNSFRNEQNTSGHLTIEYAYPLEEALAIY